MVQTQTLVALGEILKARERLKGIALETPLQSNPTLSQRYGAEILFKREDLQVVRSYKLRGAYNRMAQIPKEMIGQGVVCASAGNHAQGVALSCAKLRIEGKIFMPTPTPRQKVDKVRMFGGEWAEIILTGDTFDDAYSAAREYCDAEQAVFVHPFDDPAIIAGQATVGFELLADSDAPLDYIFVPIGGGGLASGLGSYVKQISPETKIIGVEPEGAPAMYQSLQAGELLTLDQINKFVDGAAVKRVGEQTFRICQEVLDEVVLVSEGEICSTILQLYNDDAIVVEPAGALTVAALLQFESRIKGKRVACVISGGNNDITRMEEIKERAMLHQGLKYYFLIQFPQRAGALREFLNHVLGPHDDITHFEYTRKNNREAGPALVGLELRQKGDFQGLVARMQAHNVDYKLLNDQPMLFQMLV